MCVPAPRTLVERRCDLMLYAEGAPWLRLFVRRLGTSGAVARLRPAAGWAPADRRLEAQALWGFATAVVASGCYPFRPEPRHSSGSMPHRSTLARVEAAQKVSCRVGLPDQQVATPLPRLECPGVHFPEPCVENPGGTL